MSETPRNSEEYSELENRLYATQFQNINEGEISVRRYPGLVKVNAILDNQYSLVLKSLEQSGLFKLSKISDIQPPSLDYIQQYLQSVNPELLNDIICLMKKPQLLLEPIFSHPISLDPISFQVSTGNASITNWRILFIEGIDEIYEDITPLPIRVRRNEGYKSLDETQRDSFKEQLKFWSCKDKSEITVPTFTQYVCFQILSHMMKRKVDQKFYSILKDGQICDVSLKPYFNEDMNEWCRQRVGYRAVALIGLYRSQQSIPESQFILTKKESDNLKQELDTLLTDLCVNESTINWHDKGQLSLDDDEAYKMLLSIFPITSQELQRRKKYSRYNSVIYDLYEGAFAQARKLANIQNINSVKWIEDKAIELFEEIELFGSNTKIRDLIIKVEKENTKNAGLDFSDCIQALNQSKIIKQNDGSYICIERHVFVDSESRYNFAIRFDSNQLQSPSFADLSAEGLKRVYDGLPYCQRNKFREDKLKGVYTYLKEKGIFPNDFPNINEKRLFESVLKKVNGNTEKFLQYSDPDNNHLNYLIRFIFERLVRFIAMQDHFGESTVDPMGRLIRYLQDLSFGETTFGEIARRYQIPSSQNKDNDALQKHERDLRQDYLSFRLQEHSKFVKKHTEPEEENSSNSNRSILENEMRGRALSMIHRCKCYLYSIGYLNETKKEEPDWQEVLIDLDEFDRKDIRLKASQLEEYTHLIRIYFDQIMFLSDVSIDELKGKFRSIKSMYERIQELKEYSMVSDFFEDQPLDHRVLPGYDSEVNETLSDSLDSKSDVAYDDSRVTNVIKPDLDLDMENKTASLDVQKHPKESQADPESEQTKSLVQNIILHDQPIAELPDDEIELISLDPSEYELLSKDQQNDLHKTLEACKPIADNIKKGQLSKAGRKLIDAIEDGVFDHGGAAITSKADDVLDREKASIAFLGLGQVMDGYKKLADKCIKTHDFSHDENELKTAKAHAEKALKEVNDLKARMENADSTIAKLVDRIQKHDVLFGALESIFENVADSIDDLELRMQKDKNSLSTEIDFKLNLPIPGVSIGPSLDLKNLFTKLGFFKKKASPQSATAEVRKKVHNVFDQSKDQKH